MNHEVADPVDVENNGWKFGWKFEGEEHPIPEWPNYKVSNFSQCIDNRIS